MALDPAYSALIGATIGATAGLLGSLISGWRQSRLEEQKWRRARRDIVKDDVRRSTADLARNLASFAHSMMWSTFKALNAMKVHEDDLRTYENETHHAIAELVRSQMHLAASDATVYAKITPMVSEAISLGGETFTILEKAIVDIGSVESNLHACNAKALNFIKRIPNELAEVLRQGF